MSVISHSVNTSLNVLRKAHVVSVPSMPYDDAYAQELLCMSCVPLEELPSVFEYIFSKLAVQLFQILSVFENPKVQNTLSNCIVVLYSSVPLSDEHKAHMRKCNEKYASKGIRVHAQIQDILSENEHMDVFFSFILAAQNFELLWRVLKKSFLLNIDLFVKGLEVKAGAKTLLHVSNNESVFPSEIIRSVSAASTIRTNSAVEQEDDFDEENKATVGFVDQFASSTAQIAVPTVVVPATEAATQAAMTEKKQQQEQLVPSPNSAFISVLPSSGSVVDLAVGAGETSEDILNASLDLNSPLKQNHSIKPHYAPSDAMMVPADIFASEADHESNIEEKAAPKRRGRPPKNAATSSSSSSVQASVQALQEFRKNECDTVNANLEHHAKRTCTVAGKLKSQLTKNDDVAKKYASALVNRLIGPSVMICTTSKDLYQMIFAEWKSAYLSFMEFSEFKNCIQLYLHKHTLVFNEWESVCNFQAEPKVLKGYEVETADI